MQLGQATADFLSGYFSTHDRRNKTKAAYRLGGHLKTGHTRSPENRPTEQTQDSVVLLHQVM